MTTPDHNGADFIVEKLFPNEPDATKSSTEAIIRTHAGNRMRVLLHGGTHQQIIEGTHYSINTILDPNLDAASTAAFASESPEPQPAVTA